MKAKYRTNERIELTHFIPASADRPYQSAGTIGIVRGVSLRIKQPARYCIAIPKTGNCVDGVVEYWRDEDEISRIGDGR